MLSKLLNTIKRGFRKIGQRGYTLIEVAAVVAITATLAAVVVPIAVDKIKEGRIAAANGEVNTIASAINALYAHTGEWPVNSTATQDYYQMLYSGIAAPTAATIFSTAPPTPAGELRDHLITNGDLDTTTSDDLYDAAEWKGRYMAEDKLDPWGNPYIVYTKFLHKGETKTTTLKAAWVLSAGPDEVIDTDVDDDSVQDDDLGVPLR